MMQCSNLNNEMEIKVHFKNKAKQKNLINRGNFALAIIALFVAIIGCDKQEGMNEVDYSLHDEMSGTNLNDMFLDNNHVFCFGTNLNDMVLDNNHVFYFVTSEVDREEKMPIWSSYIPFRYYLSSKTTETGNFEIINDRFVNGKLCFDKKNNLWCYDFSTVYQVEGSSYNKILELPANKGIFQFIAADNDNNIWAGGLQTGLYKIDSHLKITHYDMLPSTIIDAIHIDKNNTVWVGFWGGVLKISNDQWTVYDNFTTQRIWCMVTDKNGNLWAGSGWTDENQTLMRFDGTRWETVNPRNEKNEIVKGTVRHLQSDGRKIYVVVEQVKNLAFHSNELLTFDGAKWNRVHEIPEDDGIADLVVDDYRNVVYVRTLNRGIFKIPIE